MTNSNSIFNNPFEKLNLQLPQKTIKEFQKVVKEEAKNISVNPFLNYLDENEKVFNGEVAREIRKCHAQIYALGQMTREGQPISTFSITL